LRIDTNVGISKEDPLEPQYSRHFDRPHGSPYCLLAMRTLLDLAFGLLHCSIYATLVLSELIHDGVRISAVEIEGFVTALKRGKDGPRQLEEATYAKS